MYAPLMLAARLIPAIHMGSEQNGTAAIAQGLTICILVPIVFQGGRDGD